MFMLAVLLFAASPKAGPQFDAPLSKRTVVVGPSTTATGNIVRTCWSYGGFTIAETNDPGNKGAVAVVVRGTDAPEKECVAEGKALDVPEGYFWGAIGRFAVTHSADGFGDIEGFTVHDSTTAKTLYDAEGDLSDVAMKQHDGTLALTYRHRVKLDCNPATNAKCWSNALAANEIPPELRIALPRCRKKWLGVLVTLHARVEDVAAPKRIFRSEPARCTEAP